MNHYSKVCLSISLISLAGCSYKQPLEKITYKEVVKPVKCNIQIPIKPIFNRDNLESAKELSMYYEQIESILKECVTND